MFLPFVVRSQDPNYAKAVEEMMQRIKSGTALRPTPKRRVSQCKLVSQIFIQDTCRCYEYENSIPSTCVRLLDDKLEEMVNDLGPFAVQTVFLATSARKHASLSKFVND